MSRPCPIRRVSVFCRMLLAAFLPAGLFAISSGTRQRLGDMLAGTFVLKNGDLARIGEGEDESAHPDAVAEDAEHN
jgi:hypothetical protein